MTTGQTPSRGHRVAGYALSVIAGALVAIALLSLANYVNAWHLGTGGDVARCLGLGRYGWVGPLFVLTVVAGLAVYLGRSGAGGAGTQLAGPERRCLACGHRIFDEFRICPYCGSLTGKTRHQEDDYGL